LIVWSHHGLTIAGFSEKYYFISSTLLTIAKNRLHTSLSDEKHASLLVLASEKDLMIELKVDDKIRRSLKSHSMQAYYNSNLLYS